LFRPPSRYERPKPTGQDRRSAEISFFIVEWLRTFCSSPARCSSPRQSPFFLGFRYLSGGEVAHQLATCLKVSTALDLTFSRHCRNLFTDYCSLPNCLLTSSTIYFSNQILFSFSLYKITRSGTT